MLFIGDSIILEAPVTEREFLEQLHELNHKINFVKEQSFKDARSCLDVRDTLDKLRVKVAVYNTYLHTYTYIWLIIAYDTPHSAFSGTVIYIVML